MPGAWERITGYTLGKLTRAIRGVSRLEVETQYQLDSDSLPVAWSTLEWDLGELGMGLFRLPVPDPILVSETICDEDAVVQATPELVSAHRENVEAAPEHWKGMAETVARCLRPGKG